MKHLKLFTLLCWLITAMACSSSKKVTENQTDTKTDTKTYSFHFETDDQLTRVLDKAKAQKKLVYVDIGASWCVPCKLMKRDVYTDKETADFFNKNFVNYLVDGEKNEGPDLCLIYQVNSYPTLLILDEKGRIVSRQEGAIYHRDLVEFGKEALGQ